MSEVQVRRAVDCPDDIGQFHDGGQVAMYFIIKGKGTGKDDWTNPGVRKTASDAYDKAMSLPLREAAMERRRHLKALRMAKLAHEYGVHGGEQRAAEEKAAMRAIKRSMERRINE